jgi:hypothetical protein
MTRCELPIEYPPVLQEFRQSNYRLLIIAKKSIILLALKIRVGDEVRIPPDLFPVHNFKSAAIGMHANDTG